MFALLLALRLFEAVEPHMGTLVRIKLFAADRQRADAAFRAAFERIRQLDEILSDYKPDSELNRIARTAVNHPVEVSADLFAVLETSQKLAIESGGAFDVTIGPLTHLWRDARKRGRPPDPAAIREAARRCGYRKLHLDGAKRTVTLDEAGMQLDVGGIAKGYAADAALGAITRLGVHSALVAASGDLAFSGAPPGKRGWKVGLDPDDNPSAGFACVIELINAAVSTSANTEQHLDAGGKRYSHIIDPATGEGLTRDIRVTVIAPRGAMADGMSTAISVLGADRGLALVERHPGVGALIVSSNGVRMSSRFCTPGISPSRGPRQSDGP